MGWWWVFFFPHWGWVKLCFSNALRQALMFYDLFSVALPLTCEHTHVRVHWCSHLCRSATLSDLTSLIVSTFVFPFLSADYDRWIWKCLSSLTLLRISRPWILTTLLFIMHLSLVFKIVINSMEFGIWLNVHINSRLVHLEPWKIYRIACARM